MAKKEDEPIRLEPKRLAEGFALHSFVSVAKSLNEASKRYAKETLGANWVTRILPAVTKRRADKLAKIGDTAVDELWDAHDVLSVLKLIAANRLRSAETHRSGKAPGELVFFENVSEVLMLRTCISHMQTPPLGNVMSAMGALASVLEKLDCSNESSNLRQRSGALQRVVAAEGGISRLEAEAIRIGIVLTAYHYMETALAWYCKNVNAATRTEFEREEKQRKAKDCREMEVDDLLEFIGEHPENWLGPCPDFEKKVRPGFKRFRNKLFHAEDKLPPPTDVNSAFWGKFKVLLENVLGRDVFGPLLEEMEVIDGMLERTKKWKKDNAKSVCCGKADLARSEVSAGTESAAPSTGDLQLNVSKTAETTHWISRPQVKIVGRDTELQQIISLLERPSTVQVLIWGDSGIGKSSLAAEAAYHLRRTLPAQHFIRCTTPETYNNSLVLFASAGGYMFDPSMSSEERVADVHRWIIKYLSQTCEPILLVFDDLRDPQQMEKLPLENHKVIVTSLPRKKSMHSNEYSLLVNLGPLAVEDSLKAMVNICKGGRKSRVQIEAWPDVGNAEEWLSLLQISTETLNVPAEDVFQQLKELLTNQLFNLPLAVDIAGHLLSQTLSPETLFKSFVGRGGGVDETQSTAAIQDKSSSSEHALAVSGMVHLALHLLQHSQDTCDLAYMIASMACPTVPLQIFTASQVELIHELESNGILRINRSKHNVFMHPLTQNVLVQTLSSTDEHSSVRQTRISENLFTVLCDSMKFPSPKQSSEDKWLCHDVAICAEYAVSNRWLRRLMNDAHRVQKTGSNHILEQCFDLLAKLGEYHNNHRENIHANPEKARTHLQMALEIGEEIYGAGEDATIGIRVDLAVSLTTLGHYLEGEKVIGQALQLFALRRGEETENMGLKERLFSAAGNVSLHLGDYHQAGKLYKTALSVAQNHYGQDHVQVATTLEQSGDCALIKWETMTKPRLSTNVLWQCSKITTAKTMCEVATTLGNLASVLHQMGDYDQAKALYERALAVQQNHYGQDHVEVARTLGNLARCTLSKAGRL